MSKLVKVKANDIEFNGLVGFLIALPILTITYVAVALLYLFIATILFLIAFSPFILIGLLVWLI